MKENNYSIRKKRILFTVIIITLLAIAALYASLNPHVRQWISYHSEPSDAFIEQVSRLYENPDYCTITDEEGNDISETFYLDTLEFYEKGDFIRIHQYFIDVDASRIESDPSMYQ